MEPATRGVESYRSAGEMPEAVSTSGIGRCADAADPRAQLRLGSP